MNKEMTLGLEKLTMATREQMVCVNAAWIRSNKLAHDENKIVCALEVTRKERSVADEDLKIQQGKLSKMLLEEKL